MVIDQTGILFVREKHKAEGIGVDLVYPYIILTLCLRGNVRGLYDMQEMQWHKNDLTFIMPGHIVHLLECTEDLEFAELVVSPKLFHDVRLSTFTHDFAKFHHAPVCSLTDEQAQHLIAIADQLNFILSHTEEELPQRRHMLMAQLAVGYEFLNFFRREQDRAWTTTPHADLYSRFCDLVVMHYREAKDIRFYAEKFDLSPKYFSQVIRKATKGLSPGEWIEQYVVTQAKQLIDTHPDMSLKQVAYQLGFAEPTSFYRYFKRVTGITAGEYREL